MSKSEKEEYSTWTMLDFDLYLRPLPNHKITAQQKKELEEIEDYIKNKEEKE